MRLKFSAFRIWLPLAILLLSASRGVGADAPYTYAMFDGKSLAGWTIENGCEVTVVDGKILLKAGDGWLRSNHMYSDFKLHVEWQALQKTNYDAGIYLRTVRGGSPFPKRSFQSNLLQGKEGNISKLPGAASTGLVKPAGNWNVFDYTVSGDRVTLAINGKPAYSVTGLAEPIGHIGIQVEVPKGGQFYLKNMRVTETSHQPLFVGKGFDGWEGAGQPAELCWAVEDGVLTGLAKKGPWLRTKKQYDNFNLRFDYRLAPGANSGVYVRVPENGNHHRDDQTNPPAGFEVQILDDSAKKYAHLKDYQYSGSVYDIAGAASHVSKSPGQWNTLEINCDGYHIITTHNGTVIVDARPGAYPLLKLRKLKGFLGFQNHGGGVKFRNVRVGPPLPCHP